MAFSENYVRLMGKALDNPEVVSTQSGTQMVKFHLGIPTIRNSQQIDEPFEVVAFGSSKLAFDEISNLVRAGRLIAVTGKLSSRESRSPRDGRVFYNYTIIATRTQADETETPVQKPVVQNAYNPWAEIDDDKLPF